MLDSYREHEKKRKAKGIPAKPLDAKQVIALIELLKNPPAGDESLLITLFCHRIPAGVDEAAYVKASFLSAIVHGTARSPLINRAKATKILGTLLGGYNVDILIELLDDPELAPIAASALSNTLLMFDAYHDVIEKAASNPYAKQVSESWAEAKWFTRRSALPEKITVTVFKVEGETNTDDLSPATEAWSRPDIPLHALAMLQSRMENPLQTIQQLKAKQFPLAYVGDVIGTGSSRKSATNSVLWHMGDDIPFIPNKRTGGICLGGKIAPIFLNTMQDAGALPIECDVSKMQMGDVISIYPYEGIILNEQTGAELSRFQFKSDVILDEVRAGGRIPLIIGRGLTDKTREALGLSLSDVFKRPVTPQNTGKGFTLAQKMVGQACGIRGVRPGQYCEPKMTTVGSQDTTGPMTRDELKDLACLGFSADLVMQSFCHTAAYPKPVDIDTQHTLPDFIRNRGGVSLKPRDGIIHSWLNRMLLPDTVGTGGDSHTRFPLGISFPAGSGLVAFAAATGVMPLDMPESILLRFSGEIQPGITLRDLVNAIPYVAIQQGLLTIEKQNKNNIFSGRILEIEGLPDLKIEQAFEISDASAERSAAGCTILLNEEPILEYLQSNITLLKWMISESYGDKRTIERRIAAMQAWIANPQLMKADKNADYTTVIEVDLNTIKEPLLACPNDPDDIKPLSAVAGTQIDEVFIGSCMTNIGHFRAAGKMLNKHANPLPTRLWICPPTKMDEHQLMEEGYYNIFAEAGARTEIPGCSLCMGNQARVVAKSTVVSTSTRNFPNRLGNGANVYLASAELAAISSILGHIPNQQEYQQFANDLEPLAADIYRYMNFHEIDAFKKAAASVDIPNINIDVLSA